VCQEYDIGHEKNVSGVVRTLGALFTSSFDGTVKVLEPTREPSVITELCPHDGEVSRVRAHQAPARFIIIIINIFV